MSVPPLLNTTVIRFLSLSTPVTMLALGVAWLDAGDALDDGPHDDRRAGLQGVERCSGVAILRVVRLASDVFDSVARRDEDSVHVRVELVDAGGSASVPVTP